MMTRVTRRNGCRRERLGWLLTISWWLCSTTTSRISDAADFLIEPYPIYPELFDRLYKDWSSIELFQQTRDVLRLVAAVIHTLWEREDRRLVVLPDAMIGFRILLERANKLGISGPEFYVFAACEHGHIDGTKPQKTWRTSWRNLTRVAGLSALRFHDLRHQCITELLENGSSTGSLVLVTSWWRIFWCGALLPLLLLQIR
jgi:hypothetical protein